MPNLDVARQWAAKAHNDLVNADNNLRSTEIPYDTVCFHCQQAAEKLLKCILAYHGHHPKPVHDLMFLLAKVAELRPEAADLRDTILPLESYAVEIRYPDDWHMPTPEEALEAREAAGLVLEWVRSVAPMVLQTDGDLTRELG